MIKWLIVVGVIGAIYFLFIKKKAPIANTNKQDNTKEDKKESNDMVECSRCGIFVDMNETIISSNKYYCSDECLEKAK